MFYRIALDCRTLSDLRDLIGLRSRRIQLVHGTESVLPTVQFAQLEHVHLDFSSSIIVIALIRIGIESLFGRPLAFRRTQRL